MITTNILEGLEQFIVSTVLILEEEHIKPVQSQAYYENAWHDMVDALCEYEKITGKAHLNDKLVWTLQNPPLYLGQ